MAPCFCPDSRRKSAHFLAVQLLLLLLRVYSCSDSDHQTTVYKKQSGPATGVPVTGALDQRPCKNDSWSTRMREKIVGDATKASSLIPEHFKRVREVINTVSFIFGPKEGDTPDRAKYSQGTVGLHHGNMSNVIKIIVHPKTLLGVHWMIFSWKD